MHKLEPQSNVTHVSKFSTNKHVITRVIKLYPLYFFNSASQCFMSVWSLSRETLKLYLQNKIYPWFEILNLWMGYYVFFSQFSLLSILMPCVCFTYRGRCSDSNLKMILIHDLKFSTNKCVTMLSPCNFLLSASLSDMTDCSYPTQGNAKTWTWKEYLSMI